MRNFSASDPVELLKDRVTDVILIVLTLLSIPTLASSVMRYNVTGWLTIYTIQFLLVILLLFTLFFRKRLSRQLKTGVIVAICGVTALLGLLYFGYFGSAKLYIIPACIFAGLLINRRVGFGMLGILVVMYLVFAYLYTYGGFRYTFDVQDYIYRFNSWLSSGASIILVALGLMIIMYHYENSYVRVLQSAQENKEGYRALFEQAADGIIISNREGYILNVNRSFCEMSGYDCDELIGKHLSILLTKEDLEAQPLEYNRASLGDIILNVRTGLRKDGSQQEIEMRTRILSDGRFQSVIRDISAPRELQRKLGLISLQAEENERERLAKELHDGLGPIISASKIYLHNIKDPEDDIYREAYLFKLEQSLDEALTGIREISNNISPHMLRNFGLVQAVKSFTDELKSLLDIELEVHIDATKRFAETLELTAYRIICELIQNTLKYAEAERIDISFEEGKDKLRVEYRDDGKGFNYEKVLMRKKGFGLLNIESRINALNGRYLYTTKPGEGVKVVFEFKI